MKKQVFNPYMPSWEYVPDGEPHVFGDRIYVYGSHDIYNGWMFCLGDYICYSAPLNDLSDWKYEGVIYDRREDPLNRDGRMNMYAPDVTQGPDGRYYLYYVNDVMDIVSVAVCDTPAGEYKFHGYVQYPDGTLYGRNKEAGDEPQFDPAVLTEGDNVYLYTGFCRLTGVDRHGAMVTRLDKDMLTVLQPPKFVLPSGPYTEGTGFENNPYFEAPSIRKFNGVYYLVYSSTAQHELCYATSDKPDGDFTYRGVLISNRDIGIDKYKPIDMRAARGGNNHGGLVCVNGQYYIFYHRHTNNTSYSRQACAEPTFMEADGSFRQVEMTSCGLNGGPLEGKGYYPAYIACNIFEKDELPYIVQEGRDGDEEDGYVTNITDSSTVGFKYFKFDGTTKRIKIWVRGYPHGYYDVRTELDGEILSTIEIFRSSNWWEYSAPITIPEGTHALYFTYRGGLKSQLRGFELE
jgi:hypothetical protein